MDTLIYVRLLITNGHIYSMEYTIRSASARKSVSQASSTTRSFPYCRRGIAKNGNNVGQNIVDRECSSLVNILYVLAVHESAYLASKARNTTLVRYLASRCIGIQEAERRLWKSKATSAAITSQPVRYIVSSYLDSAHRITRSPFDLHS